MISVIIPTTSFESGARSGQQVKQVLARFEIVNEIIVVLDGIKPIVVDLPTDIRFLETGHLSGSYNARNLGAGHASYNKLLFLDDGSEISISSEFVKQDLNKRNTLIGPKVRFFDEPMCPFSLWYSVNAFDQETFSNRYRFLPTIALLVDKSDFQRAGGFDRRLTSSGDVAFSHEAIRNGCDLFISKNFTCTTGLRNKAQLQKKTYRQTFGHAYRVKLRRSTFSYYIYLMSRIILNSLCISGLSGLRRLKSSQWRDYLIANQKVCWWKAAALFKCLPLSSDSLETAMATANRYEVEGQ